MTSDDDLARQRAISDALIERQRKRHRSETLAEKAKSRVERKKDRRAK